MHSLACLQLMYCLMLQCVQTIWVYWAETVLGDLWAQTAQTLEAWGYKALLSATTACWGFGLIVVVAAAGVMPNLDNRCINHGSAPLWVI